MKDPVPVRGYTGVGRGRYVGSSAFYCSLYRCDGYESSSWPRCCVRALIVKREASTSERSASSGSD
jgi:hypothetical protein